ncbi:sigma-70 region 4 domain-containing protein [Propionicicella superfundia]|uniref:sigma-70 region 4 domain-containing protein n=1 Tax=Propionicicella superfundia TaxID=348582 RepID=UPI001B7FEB6F|nr:sigma-70 region 4 domain-containing protein [Propionicicella superfundia]
MSMSMGVPEEARAAERARLRKVIADLDYGRELRRLHENGHSYKDIARLMRVTEPAVRNTLHAAAKAAMPLDGFSSATPEEICERYGAGFIDRDQLIDELSRYPYAPGGHTDGYDTLIFDPPGAWSEVSAARWRGLIDDDVYEEVFNRRHPARKRDKSER